jgi:hypothetical protein
VSFYPLARARSSACLAVTHWSRQHLIDQHISRFNADADDPGHLPDHGVVPGLRLLLQPFLFKARLTWAELHDLQVLRCEEDFPRVAYLCLRPQLSFVTFPAHTGPVPVWGGTELRPGEIVFHGRGERLHQSTPGSFVWNVGE